MKRMVKRERDFVRDLRKTLSYEMNQNFYSCSFNDPCVSGGYRLIVNCVDWMDVIVLEKTVKRLASKYKMTTRIEVTSKSEEDQKLARVFYKCDESIRILNYSTSMWTTVREYCHTNREMTRAETSEYVQSTYKRK